MRSGLRRSRLTRVACVLTVSGVLLTTLATSCREPTQMSVTFRSNACADAPQLGIVSAPGFEEARRRSEALALNATQAGCRASDELGTLTVTPGDGLGGATLVAVVGLRGKSAETCAKAPGQPGCIIARRQFSFIEHTPLALTVELNLDCEGLACTEFSTCRGGTCVDARVECNATGCSDPGKSLDGGSLPPLDGAPPDPPRDGGDSAVPNDAGNGDGGDASNGDGGGAADCPAQSVPLCGPNRTTCGAGAFCCIGKKSGGCGADTAACTSPHVGCCAYDLPCGGGRECCAYATGTRCTPEGGCPANEERLCTLGTQCRVGEYCDTNVFRNYFVGLTFSDTGICRSLLGMDAGMMIRH